MNIFSKIYRKYCKYYYRRFPDKKGSWRIKRELAKLASRNEKHVEEEELIFEKEADWKNLIILDAARHDLYEEVNGETGSRYTVGSQSTEFIEKTFSEGDYTDTIYITANPFFNEEKFREITGRKPEDVFHEVFHTYMDKWDDENNTVMPESLVQDAKTAEKLFPEKRKIIHFMQPHYPFVNSDLADTGINPDLDRGRKDFSLWQLAEMGDYEREELWQPYRENLELVMPHAEELVEYLPGTTVITADHGNMVGESGLYGHPRGLKLKPLRKVPWDVRKDE
jgi:hypothetical protein